MNGSLGGGRLKVKAFGAGLELGCLVEAVLKLKGWSPCGGDVELLKLKG